MEHIVFERLDQLTRQHAILRLALEGLRSEGSFQDIEIEALALFAVDLEGETMGISQQLAQVIDDLKNVPKQANPSHATA